MTRLTDHSQSWGAGTSRPASGPGGYSAHNVLVQSYLRDLLFSEDPRLSKLVGAIRYSLSAGDERIRSVLCMEVAESFGLDPSEVLPSAAAIELIHTGSAVHGDLPAMGVRRRRRTPACHEEFGETIAILAGDACFSESLSLIAFYQNGTTEQILRVIADLADSTGASGMVGEQRLSLDRAGRAETSGGTQGPGTGILLVTAARIGAILAGASPEDQEHVSEYARRLGLCYGIVEDPQSAGPAGEERADEALRGALEALDGMGADTRGLAEMARRVRSGSGIYLPARS